MGEIVQQLLHMPGAERVRGVICPQFFLSSSDEEEKERSGRGGGAFHE
jgi:hypothetical protein